MFAQKVSNIIYGGDYNPEQWSEKVWLEDMELMKEVGVNLVTIGVFSWAALQPEENKYKFGWLDRVLDLLAEHKIYADLATATAAQPAWMSKKYNDILPVDEYGNKVNYGSRQSYCPNSSSYRRLGQKLVKKLAKRYQDHPALALWHVNNEYGAHTSACYCDTCAEKFRDWLKKQYNDLETVNEAWGTNFWSQRYYNWEEIIPPRATATFKNPAQVLDYKRFMSDSLLKCYTEEVEILRDITPEIPITTNFMADFKPLNYFKWAEKMDIVGLDCYPDIGPDYQESWAAFNYDLMRGLKENSSFILMEQAPNQVQWRNTNPNKRPGVMRQGSYQAVAHGADGIMFFQWRQSNQGAEKFHSGMVTHAGDKNSRVFKEVTNLGYELDKLSELTGAKVLSEVAILFDYENWWAVENETTPSNEVKYLDQIRNYYDPLFKSNIPVDIVSYDGDFSNYKIVIAPLMYMIKEGVAEKIEKFVNQGGVFITSFFSGIVNETDKVFSEGYPGPLKNTLGIKIEEFDALKPGMSNKIKIQNYLGQAEGKYRCNLWCDLIHTDTAKILATFEEDYYAGYPAVTANKLGAGKAYYIATQVEEDFRKEFLEFICQNKGVNSRFDAPSGVEVISRSKDEQEYIFVLNYTNKERKISLDDQNYLNLITEVKVKNKLSLSPKEIAILTLN